MSTQFPPRLIFLDIDGVLNHYRYLADHGHDSIDPDAVARLNRIIGQTDAGVVISSVWRILHRLADLRGRLKNLGFTIVGKTPHLNGPPRGEEIDEFIQSYTRNCKVESLVILDDDDDMKPWSHRLVQTHPAEGILDRHVDQAIALLRMPLP